MRIGIAVYSMQAGGTERVVSILANAWVKGGHAVSIFTFDNTCAESFYKLSSAVGLIKLGMGPGINIKLSKMFSFMKKYYNFRKIAASNGHDVLISFTSEINILVLAAVTGLKIPVLVCERSDPKIIPKGALWRMLRRVFYYRLPAAIIVQNDYAAHYFEEIYKTRIVAIPNPIELAESPQKSSRGKSSKLKILAVGRLVKEKRHELLINAAQRLLSLDGDANIELIIIGEGPMQTALQNAIAQSGLEHCVAMHGFSSDPWEGVEHGDIYVQCSDFEGFPNALCEAMSRGCAVISTIYSPAATEIIQHNRNGILIPPNNVSALCAALGELMASPARRKEIGDAAREFAAGLNVDLIEAKWISSMEEVIADAR